MPFQDGLYAYIRSKSHNATSRSDFSSDAVRMRTISGRENNSPQCSQKNVEQRKRAREDGDNHIDKTKDTRKGMYPVAKKKDTIYNRTQIPHLIIRNSAKSIERLPCKSLHFRSARETTPPAYAIIKPSPSPHHCHAPQTSRPNSRWGPSPPHVQPRQHPMYSSNRHCERWPWWRPHSADSRH